MTQPKYKIGDKVWTLNKIKAFEVEITGVRVIKATYGQKKGADESSIKYAFDSRAEIFEDESFYFPTKQSLIESL